MKFAIFGLSVSSSWGNGHAVLWRGLISALLNLGHEVTFFERDTEYYANNRDLTALPPGGDLVLYPDWRGVRSQAQAAVDAADVAIVTSYCPDALAATELLADAHRPLRCFYDLDTPVTLARIDAGESVDYLGREGLAAFDLVLSYTGGGALTALRDLLGARRVAPLYGWVDPTSYAPAAPDGPRAALSYLGTYAADRQDTLERLFVAPARSYLGRRFVIGGAQYPQDFPWTKNIYFVRHVPPADHPAFYANSRVTLNVTRGAMARMGWCPSGRLFEAAACGVPILSDCWAGLEEFFRPGIDILVADSTDDALQALEMPDAELARVADSARSRVLALHTAAHRAETLVTLVSETALRESA